MGLKVVSGCVHGLWLSVPVHYDIVEYMIIKNNNNNNNNKTITDGQ